MICNVYCGRDSIHMGGLARFGLLDEHLHSVDVLDNVVLAFPTVPLVLSSSSEYSFCSSLISARLVDPSNGFARTPEGDACNHGAGPFGTKCGG